ncbi:MAG: GNAT family N-acetyltransferase [Hyphomicrobiaceae bacterium]
MQATHAAGEPTIFKPPSSLSFPASEVELLFDHPSNFIFLAVNDAEPAGYLFGELIERGESSITYAHRVVYVHHLAVDSRFRRQGLGSKLLGAAEEIAREHGISAIALDTWSFNRNAGQFFEQAGFSPYNVKLRKEI